MPKKLRYRRFKSSSRTAAPSGPIVVSISLTNCYKAVSLSGGAEETK